MVTPDFGVRNNFDIGHYGTKLFGHFSPKIATIFDKRSFGTKLPVI